MTDKEYDKGKFDEDPGENEDYQAGLSDTTENVLHAIKKLKRWELVDEYESDAAAVPEKTGDWVRWEDVVEIAKDTLGYGDWDKFYDGTI